MESTRLYEIGGMYGVIGGLLGLMVVGIIVSKLLTRTLRRLFADEEHTRVGGSIFINMARIIIWCIDLTIILDECFNIDAVGIIGALGIVGIAVSLGCQQTLSNLIGGLIISFSRSIAPGDWITINGSKESVVVDTDWRSTTLQDEDGIQYIVPNAEMVSSVVAKGNPFYVIVVPFALALDTPNVEGLLVECEQVLLDRQIATGHDYEGMRPKASAMGTEVDGIRAEVKLYVNREYDTRYVLRAVAPALIELLQQRNVLARVDVHAAA